MRRIYNLLYLSIFIFILIQICMVHNFFDNTSLPVFDGVMNEKNQIFRFLNFKGDYSLKQRIIQAYLEFKGNPVTAGFNIPVILISPISLANDIDIYVRAILVLFILFWTLNKFIDSEKGVIKLITIYFIANFPLFYHYRFGLLTYVPDLISGVILFCSYLNLLLFYRDEKIIYFVNCLWMIFIAIAFRFNFFAYVGILFLPFLYSTFKLIYTKKRKELKKYIVLISIFFVLLSVYIAEHFDAFMRYYNRPATYEKSSLASSITFFNDYLNYELGAAFIVSFIFLLILNNCFTKHFFSITKWNLVLIYPFLSLFSFLIIYLHAGNQPHVFAFLFFFSVPLTFVKIPFLNFTNFFKPKYTYIGMLVLGFVFNLSFFYKKMHTDYKSELNNDGLILAQRIEKEFKNKSVKKYFIMFDAALEIPLDVYFFKKTSVWNDNKLRFYFTDWDYYGISTTLNVQEIKEYYIRNIINQKPKLIFINDGKLELGEGRELASVINDSVKNFIITSKLYTKVDRFYYNNRLINTYKLN
jgi:hypothetical protein